MIVRVILQSLFVVGEMCLIIWPLQYCFSNFLLVVFTQTAITNPCKYISTLQKLYSGGIWGDCVLFRIFENSK